MENLYLWLKHHIMKNLFYIAGLCILLASCTNYGTKIDFNGDEVYYKDPVTEQEATQVGEFLKSYQYFTGQGFTVQVLKEEGYTVRFATKEGIENDADVMSGFKFLLIDMSAAAFNGDPITVDLCDETLNTKVTITHAEAKSFMEKMLTEQPL